MRNWTPEELAQFADTEEIEIAPIDAERTTGRFTPIWVVRVGDELYIRSGVANGSRWYRRARASGRAHVRVDGAEHLVGLDDAVPSSGDIVTEAYRTKYARYAGSYLEPLISSSAVGSTVRLVAQ